MTAIKTLENGIRDLRGRLEYQINRREQSLLDVVSRQTTIKDFEDEIKELEIAIKKLQE